MFEIKWLGLVDYEEANKLQKQLREQVLRTGKAIILGLEHPKVITLGIRGKSSDVLKPLAPVIRSERGGQATLHNPGQLVVYPLIPYKLWKIRPIELVNSLLDNSENFLDQCNIIINNKKNGLFTNSGKIASIGLNLKGGISSHGIAINISNNLEDFKIIAPCGITACKMDRVHNYNQKINVEIGFKMWANGYAKYLQLKTPKLSESLTL